MKGKTPKKQKVDKTNSLLAEPSAVPDAPGIPYAIYFLIAAVCAALYLHCLAFGLTKNDDDVLVANNLDLLKNLSNFPKLFTTDAWYGHGLIELYRPLQGLTFMLDAQWGSDITFTAHLTNLILHAVCCMAVFNLLVSLKFRKRLALLGSLIYSVHFLFLHTVIWIPARGDLLLALFAFLSMISLIKHAENDGKYSYWPHFLFFCLALLAKETAIVLPFLYFTYLWLFSRQSIFNRSGFSLLFSYPAALAIYFFMRNYAISDTKGSVGFSAVVSNLPMVPETIAKFFVPVNFSTLPSFHASSTISGMLIIILFFLLFKYRKIRFSNLTIFSLCWFSALILPGMAYRPEFAYYTYDTLDHRSYLMCFGLLLIILDMFRETGADSKKYFRAASISLLVYLAAVNLYFSRSYRTPLTYAELAIKTNSHSALAYFLHGAESDRQGNTDRALDDYTRAIEIHPYETEALYNRAFILFHKKRYDETLADLNKLLAIKPAYNEQAYTIRGTIKELKNDYTGADKDFEEAARLNPAYRENLEMFKQHMYLRSSMARAIEMNKAGVKEGEKGNYKGAMEYFQRIIAATPDFYEAHTNLAKCKLALGDHEGACREWKIAAEHENGGVPADMLAKYCK